MKVSLDLRLREVIVTDIAADTEVVKGSTTIKKKGKEVLYMEFRISVL